MYIERLLFTGSCLVALALVGCSKGDTDTEGEGKPNGKAQPSGEAKSSGGTTPGGYDTPEAALDAYGKSLEEGDEALHRQVLVKNKEDLAGLDAIISMQTDMPRDEAARVNLMALADIQGFGKVLSKRFPAEIEGDRATIVHVFEDTGMFVLDDKFRKWLFIRESGKWYMSGSEFGDAKNLPERYAWDKSVDDVSEEMKDFVSSFDGTPEKVEEALAKHGAEGLETNMGFFGLENPVIYAKEQKDGAACYTFNVQSGQTRRKYTVRWKDGKIASVVDLIELETQRQLEEQKKLQEQESGKP